MADRWENDTEFVLGVIFKAEEKIKKMGYPSLGMSQAEIREYIACGEVDGMDGVADGDWQNSEIRAGNIRGLVRDAAKRWQSMGFVPGDTPKIELGSNTNSRGFTAGRRNALNQCLTFLPLDPNLMPKIEEEDLPGETIEFQRRFRLFARNKEIYQRIAGLRMRYWGTVSAPFSVDELGELSSSQKAWNWIEEQSARDIDDLNGINYKRFVISIEFESNNIAKQVVGVKNRIKPRLNPYSNVPSFDVNVDDYSTDTRQVAEILSSWINENADYLRFISSDFQIMHPEIKMQVGESINIEEKNVLRIAHIDEWERSIKTSPYGVLAELREEIEEISGMWSLWTPESTLEYVLTNKPPRPTTRIDLTPEWPPKLKIEVDGLTSAKEITEIFDNFCSSRGIKPSTIEESDSALLELKARYPDASWSQRLEIWVQWKKHHPNLRDFASKPKPENSIRSAWEYAVSKADWRHK